MFENEKKPWKKRLGMSQDRKTIDKGLNASLPTEFVAVWQNYAISPCYVKRLLPSHH